MRCYDRIRYDELYAGLMTRIKGQKREWKREWE